MFRHAYITQCEVNLRLGNDERMSVFQLAFSFYIDKYQMEAVLSSNDFQKRLAKVENEIHAIEQKRNRLIDMRLEETIDKAAYEKKYGEFELILSDLQCEKEQLE